jgi:ribosomal protein S1
MKEVKPKVTASSVPALPGAPAPISAEEASAFEEEFDLDALMEEWDQQKAREPESPTEGILHGTVVSVREDGLFVDVGRKSEAFLPIEAVRGRGSDGEGVGLAVGDSIDVSITGRSDDGYLTLSLVVAERPKDWSQFEAAFRNSPDVIVRRVCRAASR